MEKDEYENHERYLSEGSASLGRWLGLWQRPWRSSLGFPGTLWHSYFETWNRDIFCSTAIFVFFQAEEFSLQAAINDFHKRRYDRLPGGASLNNNNQQQQEVDPLLDLDPVDNCFLSVLGRQFELLPDFKQNYRYWLKCQVYDTTVDWEKLLTAPNLWTTFLCLTFLLYSLSKIRFFRTCR